MEKCSICLENQENLVEITQTTNNNNENHLQQLQRFVPEILWLETYKICEICRYHLEEIEKFRKLCIKLATKRLEIHNQVGVNDDVHPANLVEQKQNTNHGTNDQCSCPVCGVVMPTARHIRKHCFNVHNLERKSVRPFVCNLCRKRFYESGALKIHKLYHRGENTVICPICGKGFITYTGLLEHKRTHCQQRNYKCDQCTKSFKTGANMYTHKLVVHTDPKLWKYCCDVCNKRFPLKIKRDIHLRRHNGDKRFPCVICGMLFVCNDDMRKHLLRHSTI